MWFCYSISLVSETSTSSTRSSPLAASSSHAELLEQLKTHLAAPLFAMVSDKLSSYESNLQNAELMIQALKERLRLQRIAKYGPGSEKLTDQQLELLELEPGASNLEVAAEGVREALAPTPDRKKRKHPGRQMLPADLPRVERVIACASDQCVCDGCGQSTKVIGYEESEQLDVEPMRYFVLVTKREKRACKCCEERGVVAAPLPARIIEKSLVGDRVIIDAIISKYSNHCPLYRQSVIFQRDAGIDISRATIDNWVMRVGDLLMPLVAVMGRELVRGSYIQADETPVDVQRRDGRPRNHPAYLWQYGSPGGAAIFEFRMGRGREGPMRFLENFDGILQTDAYAGYDRVGGPKMVHAACWAHSRRRFAEATKLNQQDVVSTRIVAQMAKLFAIDAQARDESMDHAARHQLRMERAPSVLSELKAQINAADRTALPSSLLGKACAYTLRLWDKLTCFLHYPELELSNNLAENSMRPVAIGRRNWTHIGHEKAGPRIAAILSIVESCRRLKIPLREYLAAVLPGLANTSIQRLPGLTPTAWLRECEGKLQDRMK
jgi:transposase